MLFKKHHVNMIKSGIKTETRRNWKKQMVKMNGIYSVQIKMFQPKIDCELIKVKYIFMQKLKDITKEQALKEGYNSIEEFKKIFENINGFWDDELEVFVIGFKHLNSKIRRNHIENKHFKI
ncbi:MAG: ASCH domain-containing protein [Promethearchaeota archaeon]|nr:MAG: ASCH domain-containing protein [Candidatus Lokiarchaeota archaeon]